MEQVQQQNSPEVEELARCKKKIMEMTIYMEMTMKKVAQQSKVYKQRELDLQQKFHQKLDELEGVIEEKQSEIDEFEELTPKIIDKNAELEDQNQKLRRDVKDLGALVYQLNKEINYLKSLLNRAKMEKDLADKLKKQVNDQLQKLLKKGTLPKQVAITAKDNVDLVEQIEEAEKEIMNQKLKVKQADDQMKELDVLSKIPHYRDLVGDSEVKNAINKLSQKLGLPERQQKPNIDGQPINIQNKDVTASDDAYELKKQIKKLQKDLENQQEVIEELQKLLKEKTAELDGLNSVPKRQNHQLRTGPSEPKIMIQENHNHNPQQVKLLMLKIDDLQGEIKHYKRIIRHQGNGLFEYEYHDPTKVIREQSLFQKKKIEQLESKINELTQQASPRVPDRSRFHVSQMSPKDQTNDTMDSVESIQAFIQDFSETKQVYLPTSPRPVQHTRYQSNSHSRVRKLNYQLPNKCIGKAFEYIKAEPRYKKLSQTGAIKVKHPKVDKVRTTSINSPLRLSSERDSFNDKRNTHSSLVSPNHLKKLRLQFATNFTPEQTFNESKLPFIQR